jgi:predicted phosphodiesterase
MRWALLADVHSNLEALRAVLNDLEDWPGHRLICAGDLVGYGPDPVAVLELLIERGAICVMGNHDAMVLGRLGFEHCVWPGILAAKWTRTVLPRWAMNHLASLPMTARASEDVAVCHAAPDDLELRIDGAEQANAIAARFPGAALVVGGHTHFAARYGRFVNPGSVGQSRDGIHAARYARYDSELKIISFHAVDYDATQTLEKQRRAGLRAMVCYSRPPGVLDRLRARLARL